MPIVCVGSSMTSGPAYAGDTWSQNQVDTAYNAYQVRLACSADGVYLLYGDQPASTSHVYGRLSTDRGLTWSALPIAWSASYSGGTGAMSSTGQHMYFYVVSLGLYRSSDYGANWSFLGISLSLAQYILCSSDGSRVTLFSNSQTATSTDYGTSFGAGVAHGFGGSPSMYCGSDNLQYLYIGASGTAGRRSGDYGATWASLASSTATSFSCDGTGQTVYRTMSTSPYMYKSTNYGASFTSVASYPYTATYGIQVSKDGQHIVCSNIGATGYIVVTHDGFATVSRPLTVSGMNAVPACAISGNNKSWFAKQTAGLGGMWRSIA